MTANVDLIATEPEAARMLRLSPRTMQRLRAEGAGPPVVRLTERRVGYRIVDLEAWTIARVVVECAAPATDAEGAV
jgi:hypothetical protein